jgi:hypothetical protein
MRQGQVRQAGEDACGTLDVGKMVISELSGQCKVYPGFLEAAGAAKCGSFAP